MWEPFIKYTFFHNLIKKQYNTMTDIIVYVFDGFVLYSLRFFLHLSKHLQSIVIKKKNGFDIFSQSYCKNISVSEIRKL